MDNLGCEYPKKAGNAKLFFFSSMYNLNSLKKHRRREGKIIQRLDGIFYPSKHHDIYSQKNRLIKEIYLNYADFVIFQSEHSKNQCFAMFGEKDEADYTIIINGVDKSLFFPGNGQKNRQREKIKFVTSGIFRNMDMVEPIIQALDLLYGKIDFEFFLVGPVKNDELRSLTKKPYLKHRIENNPQDLAALLRDSDVFIYSFLNPPCPNSVLEALSCGLPIVSFDSGAMSEILFFARELLVPVSDDVFQKYEDFQPKKLAEKIQFAVDNLEIFKQRALDHSRLYSFEECGRHYLEIFKKFI